MTDTTLPPILFHYTTASGLLGILSSRRLWATHARFLNDAKEVEYGVEFVKSVLSAYPQSDLGILPRAPFDNVRSTYFVACLCEAGDLLSQWRGYTANQTGYAIGFETASLSSDRLFRVLYDPHEQDTAVRAVVERRLANREKLTRNDLGIEFEFDLLELAIRLKHPTFAEEREWRLVHHIDDWRPGTGPKNIGLHFRPSNHSVVPYVELSPATKPGLWKQPILRLQSLRFGPAPSPSDVREALQWLLWHHGYVVGPNVLDTKILGSATPLRL